MLTSTKLEFFDYAYHYALAHMKMLIVICKIVLVRGTARHASNSQTSTDRKSVV